MATIPNYTNSNHYNNKKARNGSSFHCLKDDENVSSTWLLYISSNLVVC